MESAMHWRGRATFNGGRTGHVHVTGEEVTGELKVNCNVRQSKCTDMLQYCTHIMYVRVLTNKLVPHIQTTVET